MKINGNDIRPGNVIEHRGPPVAGREDHAHAARQGRRLHAGRDARTCATAPSSTSASARSETVERVRLDEKDYQFLFADGDQYTFMDKETYEQITAAATS